MENKAKKLKTSARKKSNKSGIKWKLRLYVAGQTPSCLKAFNNLKKICDENLLEGYEIEIIDLLEKPHLAKDDQIIAIPTVIRRLPKPIRKAIGDLSNTSNAIIGLDLLKNSGV